MVKKRQLELAIAAGWPSSPTVQATATFTDDATVHEYSAAGSVLTIHNASRLAILSVKVWVTGSDGVATCNLWMRQI